MSGTGGTSSITVMMITYLVFNSDIVNFVWKTDEGEVESTVLLTFVLWQCFNHRWVRGCGVGQKVLFRAI